MRMMSSTPTHLRLQTAAVAELALPKAEEPDLQEAEKPELPVAQELALQLTSSF